MKSVKEEKSRDRINCSETPTTTAFFSALVGRIASQRDFIVYYEQGLLVVPALHDYEAAVPSVVMYSLGFILSCFTTEYHVMYGPQ